VKRTAGDPNVFPSLYARLTAARIGDRSGFNVKCTATLRDLGVVFWTTSGSTVAWHYRTPAGETGERNTKRNAVQALRDLANGARLPIVDVEPDVVTPTTTTTRAPRPVAPAIDETPRRSIVWPTTRPTDINVPDLTSAIHAALDRFKVTK